MLTEREQKKIKTQLIKVLKDKKSYVKETDDILIENLLFNLVLIENAKADIFKRGQMVNLRKSDEDPFFQINFSVSIFHNAIKSINQILKQLGLEKGKVEPDFKSDAREALRNIIFN